MRGLCTEWTMAHYCPSGSIGFGAWTRAGGVPRDELAQIPQPRTNSSRQRLSGMPCAENPAGQLCPSNGDTKLAPGIQKTLHW